MGPRERINTRVEPELRRAIQSDAEAKGMSESALIRLILTRRYRKVMQ